MSRFAYLLSFAFSLFATSPVLAQVIYGTLEIDSSQIVLADSSTLPSRLAIDTASPHLWQFGNTHKSYFTTDTAESRGLMTDTLHPYSVNSNASVWLAIPDAVFWIVTIKHSYQTDSLHAGCIVEYTADSGSSWQNVMGPCNANGSPCTIGFRTENFYGSSDTLLTGEPCFMGSQKNRISRFQVYGGCPIRLTGRENDRATSGCTGLWGAGRYFLRFRFKSDSTVDTLAGWKIDSIAFRLDEYPGEVRSLAAEPESIVAVPSPSASGVFTFPEIANQTEYHTVIYDILGNTIADMPYADVVDLHERESGWYFYIVTNGKQKWTGRMLYRKN